MKRKSRLLALVGVLGLVALTGAAAGAEDLPIETFCMCACPDGTVFCVGSINGDCGVPCAQGAQQFCRSDM